MGATTPAPSKGARRRRGGRRRGGGSAPMAEINVTPFVDVMLVLLIIFMVATPLLTAGVPLRLPQTAAQQLPRERTPPLTVSVDAQGLVFIGEEEVPIELLPARLAEELATRENDKVYLRADSGVGYGEVMQVMGALNANGFRNIGLVTERAQGAGPAAAPSDEAREPTSDGAAEQ